MRKFVLVHRVPGTFGHFLFQIEDGKAPALYDTWGDAFDEAIDHSESTLKADMTLTLFVPHEVKVEGGGITMEIDGFTIDDLTAFCIAGGQI